MTYTITCPHCKSQLEDVTVMHDYTKYTHTLTGKCTSMPCRNYGTYIDGEVRTND